MAVTQTAAPVFAELDGLVRLKMRLGVGMVYLQTNWRDERKFASGKQRLLGIATEAYLPGLAEMVANHGWAAVEEQRNALHERINRGWDVSGERADELFAELVAQYEVLEDALHLDLADVRHPMSVLQWRIREIETVR
jgi:hypothetical protein